MNNKKQEDITLITFIIQTDKDNEIMHDFGFHLKEAVKYNNWFSNDTIYSYTLCENINDLDIIDISKVIPIGSIEYVLGFYEKLYNISNIKPINIPKELNKFKYTQRKVMTLEELNETDLKDAEFFVKSLDKFKEFTDIIRKEDIPSGKNVTISQTIDILSEWRAFVYRGKLIDVKNYSGDFRCFPNIQTINDMIGNYMDSPNSYTLDIAVINKEMFPTVIIEVHQFFSCGLYGFNDYRLLPLMFIGTHREIIGMLN